VKALGRLPLCTLSLVAAALAVDAVPALADRLTLERAALEQGQLWRALSGHLVHQLPQVAWLDLAALLLLGGWLERRSRGLLAVVLLGSALACALAFYFLTVYERHVGSSGLAHGLLAAAIVRAFRDGQRAVALGAAALLLAKLALELSGAWPAALGSLPDGYQSAVAVHAAGVLSGALAALAWPHGGAKLQDCR
jgi:rhomboid family GlyGly-CTERM serine protease